MKPRSSSKEELDLESGFHRKATYTLPPDVLRAVDNNWRFHETLDAKLAESKSKYVADLIRRDIAKKKPGRSNPASGKLLIRTVVL